MMFPSETLWYILALKPQRNEEIWVEEAASDEPYILML